MSNSIYLVRHGQSHSNAGIYESGQTELDTTLTAKGIEQAKLRAMEFKNISFSAAYSSDLMRAIQTAELIAKPHGLPVIQSSLLRERKYAMPGNEEALRASVRGLNHVLDNQNDMSEEEKFAYKSNPDMENGNEVIERLMKFFREIEQKHIDETILIVSHGNTMRTLLFYLQYAKHHEFPAGAVKNTGYILFQQSSSQLIVKKVIDIDKSL